MFAIVDCNSFYCSCERLFRPDLEHKPVIVLSNNDGCIISRSDEAKALGIEMGVPYFKARALVEKHGVVTFSSNYNLYGNLSWRVMETLRMIFGKQYVEVYSVDEAFIDMRHLPPTDINKWAAITKDTVEQWTGIKVSVGIAPTKVLSKVANRLAKKNKQATGCIMVLNHRDDIIQALEKTPVADVWGVGRKYAEKLQNLSIVNAYQLSQQSLMWASKQLGGVVGVRLLRELQGEPSIFMHDELLNKQMIATTRMFGKSVDNLQSIKEAVATYTARAAEKLRRQFCVAQGISVFLVPKMPVNAGERFRHGPSINAYTILPVATSITGELLKPALRLAENLFEDGKMYKKAGVILSHISAANSIQGHLFKDSPNQAAANRLMQSIDNINFAMRNDIVKYASSGTQCNWKMQQNFISPRYTTRWKELCIVK